MLHFDSNSFSVSPENLHMLVEADLGVLVIGIEREHFDRKLLYKCGHRTLIVEVR